MEVKDMLMETPGTSEPKTPRAEIVPAANAALERVTSTSLAARQGALIASPEGRRRTTLEKAGVWVGVALLVVGGWAAYRYFSAAAPAEYITAAVDRGAIDSFVTTTGSCDAVVTVQVGSQVSGNIVALYADFNSKVKSGQLIARIDPAMFQARVDQAKANFESAMAAVVTARATIKKAESDIASAEANVANQKSNAVRAQSEVADADLKNKRRMTLVKEGVIAQEDADTARATYDQAVASLEAAQSGVVAAQAAVESAKAQRDVAQTQLESAQSLVNQAQAALKQTQLDLQHTEIRAPVNGVVVSRNMDLGQTVAASFQAPTIFQIAQDLSKMEVNTNVDESDVAPIQVGQRADFTVDAYPGQVFSGTVSEIRQAPLRVQNVVTYNVVVKVANPDLKLFPGMTANVKLMTGGVTDALRIPMAALRFHPAAGGAGSAPGKAPPTANTGSGVKASGVRAQTLYVLDKGNAVATRVTLGITDGNNIQVLSGLSEGQRVILSGKAKSGSSQTSSPATQTPASSTKRLGI
jgi:HlyD family secretion protein